MGNAQSTKKTKRRHGVGLFFGNSITGNAVDLTKLPSWVESVTMFKGRNPGQFVGADPSNTSYLVDPRDSTGTQ